MHEESLSKVAYMFSHPVQCNITFPEYHCIITMYQQYIITENPMPIFGFLKTDNFRKGKRKAY